VGRLVSSLNDTIALPTHKNHFRKRIWHLSPTKVKLYPLLCQNSQTFVTMATGVGRGHHEIDRPRKTPSLVEETGHMYLRRPSYSQFCDQIPKYLLPWHSGPSETNYYIDIIKWQAPVGTEIWELSPIEIELQSIRRYRGPQRNVWWK